jgi:hypothetical protein
MKSEEESTIPTPYGQGQCMNLRKEGKELSMVVPAARDGLDHKFCFV